MRPLELIKASAKEMMDQGSDDSLVWYMLGWEELESRRLKYLSISDEVDSTLLGKAIDSRLFDRLEEADLCLPDWSSILSLAQKGRCPQLRNLNVMITT